MYEDSVVFELIVARQCETEILEFPRNENIQYVLHIDYHCPTLVVNDLVS